MRINMQMLKKLSRAYGISVSELADMLSLNVSTVKGLLNEREIELTEEQAERLLQWFGTCDVIRMLTKSQAYQAIRAMF